MVMWLNHENHEQLATYPVKEWNGGRVHVIRPHVLHEEKQEEVLEQILFCLSDMSLWEKSSTCYIKVMDLLAQSKSDFYTYVGVMPDKVKELKLLTAVQAFYITTGETPYQNRIDPDEILGNINARNLLYYDDREYLRRLYRWISTPSSEVEREVYHSSLGERGKYAIGKRMRGNSYNKIALEMGITPQGVQQIVARCIRKVLYWARITGFVGYLYAFARKEVLTLEDSCKVFDSEVANVVWFALKNAKESDIPVSRYSYSKSDDSIHVTILQQR